MSADLQNPSHLFISYAGEDVVLAAWLARKLASLGYAVWFDRMEMLGGEPWPQTIDDAIKNHTFRMLALISRDALRKPKPTGERVLAQKIAEQRSISDFLIPLKVDGTELDWLTTATSYISFVNGWADGFRQLLTKLSKISTPKTLGDGISLAAMSFPSGDDLITAQSEDLLANVIRVRDVPLGLKIFAAPNSLNDDQKAALEQTWAFYWVNSKEVLAFVPPPQEFQNSIKETKEGWSWNDYDTVRGIRTRDVVANLIVKSVKVRLIKGGCLVHPDRNQTIFLPEIFTADGWLRFTGFSRKPSRLKIRGKATFRKVGKPSEINHHHFAFRMRLGRGLDKYFWIQITPTLFFFDDAGNAITDKRVGPRRKRVTRSWYNNKWLNRLLAAEKILGDFQEKATDGITLDKNLHVLSTPLSLNEAGLEGLREEPVEVEGDEDGEYLLEEEGAEESLDE